MYNNLKLNEKIDQLIVCIETLHAYQYKQLNSSKYYYNLSQDLLHIKEDNYIEYKNINSSTSHKKTIKIIQDIYKIIKKLYFKEIIINIIDNSCNKNNSYYSIKEQYLRRYKYIYQKTQDYYKMKSQTNNLNIEYQAITNLYIVNQVYNIKGIYTLIKYLYGY